MSHDSYVGGACTTFEPFPQGFKGHTRVAAASMACGPGRVDSRYETLNPSSVTDGYWVWANGSRELGDTYGKWLVFGKRGSELDGLWHTLHPLVRSGKLGATAVKCSTSLSTGTSVNDSRGVICVYTTKEMRDEVGLKVVEEVKQTIRYKSDEATLQGAYVSRGYKNTCEKTLYWCKAKGKASFGRDMEVKS